MLGLVFAASATASASATAWPTGCHYNVQSLKMTVAKCSNSHGGHYRAVADCKNPDTGAIETFVGDWRNNGSWSRAYCQGPSRTVYSGIDTKAY